MTKRFAVMLASAVVVISAVPASASAAANLFLQFENGYTTTTTDRQMAAFTGTFEIASWKWGVKRSGEVAEFGNLSFTKLMDRNSPILAQDVASGRVIGKAVLTLRQPVKSTTVLHKLCFSDAKLSGFQIGGSGASLPTEEVTMTYGAYVMNVAIVSAAGTKTGNVVKGWNVITNSLNLPAALAAC